MRENILKLSTYLIDKLIVMLIFVVPLFFVYGKGEHYYFSIYDIHKAVAVDCGAALLAAFFLTYLLLTDDVSIKRSPLILPLVLFLGINLLSFLQAYNKYESIIMFRRWLANSTILVITFQYITEKKLIRRYFNYLIVIATAVCIYGTLQFFGIDFSFLNQNFTGNATFGNPNFTGEYVILVFPLALLLMFANAARFSFFYYAVTSSIMFVYLIMNRSRAVWVGGAVGFCIVVSWVGYHMIRKDLVFRAGKDVKNNVHFIFKLGVSGFAAAIILIGISFTPLHESNALLNKVRYNAKGVYDEIKTLDHLNLSPDKLRYGDTAAQRILIWRNTLGMVAKNSIFGVGTGNFKIRYQPYRTKDEQITTGPNVFVRRSHNEYVQMLAEIGPIGIFFYLTFLIVSLRMCSQIIKHAQEYYAQCLGLGCMFSLASFYVACFFNFSLQTPTPSMTMFLILGVMASAYRVYLKRDDVCESGSAWFSQLCEKMPYVVIVCIVLLLLSPIILVRPAFAYYSYQYGQALERLGLKSKSRLELEKSLHYFYHAWETHFVLANVYASLDDLDRAIQHHIISLSLNPYHQKGHYNLANTYYKLGNVQKAIEHYIKATTIDAVFYEAFNNLGSIYIKEKEYEKGVACFKKVTELNPEFFSGQYNSGYILVLMKRYREAYPHLKKAYELKPGDPKVKKLLVKAVSEIKKQQQLPQYTAPEKK